MLSMNNMVCLTRKEVFNSEKKEFVENNQGGGDVNSLYGWKVRPAFW